MYVYVSCVFLPPSLPHTSLFLSLCHLLLPSPSLPPSLSYAGQGLINLESLETKSELQQVVDLMEEKGRRQVGGKLEVAARLREPLTGWLSNKLVVVCVCVCVWYEMMVIRV